MSLPLRIYLCGPTVYNHVHIGNLRPIMFFDILIRAYHALGHKTVLLHNITDIDDKIIAAASESMQSEAAIADTYLASYLANLKLYGITRPTHLVRVTDEVATIQEYIRRLVATNHAYVTASGIYFDIAQAGEYGQVSGQQVSSLIDHTTRDNASRDSLASYEDKRHINDFALWKFKSSGRHWQFPGYAPGRPGWHTECAALIDRYFGTECDIHGGGIDLIFPHHENENAQHQALHRQPITRRWLHVGHLMIHGAKMAKSAHNVLDPRQFARRYGVDTFRAILLQTRYSAPLDIQSNILIQGQRLIHVLRRIHNRLWLLLPSDARLNHTRPTTWVMSMLTLITDHELVVFNRQLTQAITSARGNETGQAARDLSQLAYYLGFKFATRRPGTRIREYYREWLQLVAAQDYQQADLLRARLKRYHVI